MDVAVQPQLPATRLPALPGLYTANDPLRDPYWRWTRGSYLLTNDAPFEDTDDKWVRQWVRYARRREGIVKAIRPAAGVRVGRMLRGLVREFGALHYAVSMYEHTMDTARYMIEALLTSKGTTTADVARLLGMDETVVAAYARMYYDVEDRLGSELYVRGILLGNTLVRGGGDYDCDGTWKALCYFYGPQALLSVVSAGGVTEQEKAGLDRMLRTQLTRKSLLGTMARASTAYGVHDTLQDYVAVEGVHRGELPGDDIADKAEKVLKRIEYTVRATVGVTPSTDKVEKRVFEQLAAAEEK